MRWVRLRVTGRDRVKFLHNFCTNDVKSLPAGSACEAFFTDVRARVIAHGYILAFAEHHEILQLGVDGSPLLKHLSKYIITEDVSLQLLADQEGCVAVPEDKPLHLELALSDGELASFLNPDRTALLRLPMVDGTGSEICLLSVRWAGVLMVLCVGSAATIAEVSNQISTLLLNESDLERLRIDERFPVIGRDLTSEHLAPEAERNSTAISYTKGCYLGQEPIARLDAMGHVNRALRTIEVQASAGAVAGSTIQTANGQNVGSLTSASDTSGGQCHGLSVIRLSALREEIVCVTSAGEKYEARVMPR
jgi:folate-binding protein YgfZ